MSNLFKFPQAAAAATAVISHVRHLKPIPMSLKFNYHQFAFFNDQKRTTMSRDKYGRVSTYFFFYKT